MAMCAALRKAFDDQISLESCTAHTCLAMAAYLNDCDLEGCAHWMQVQHGEEIEHADEFFHLVLERGGRLYFAAILAPGQTSASIEEVFAKAPEQEQKVTAAARGLYGMATADKGFTSLSLLQRFITEQTGEDSNAGRVLEWMRLSSAHPAALLVLDCEPGARQAD